MTQYGLTSEEIAELQEQAAAQHQRWDEPGLLPEGKYHVRRVDGRDTPGEKHEHCWYFVLDLDHDEFAIAALTAYAEACRASHPRLWADLEMKIYDAQQRQSSAIARARAASERGEQP